jgi:hypothetical protein
VGPEVGRRREADVVLCEAGGGGLGAGQVGEPGELEAALEGAASEVVQQLRHVVGEVLGAPHATQRSGRVAVELAGGAVLVVRAQRGAEQAYVVDREIEALGACRRDDVRGVAGQEEPAVLHRLADEAAHRRDALVEDRALVDLADADAQLVPDALVGPLLQALVLWDLEVEPADRGRAHRVQREAALVPGVDELIGARRRLGEDPQPAEGIDELVVGNDPVGDRGAAYAVEAIAAGDEVALQLSRRAAVFVCDARPLAVDVMDRYVGDVEVDRYAAVEQGGDLVLDDLLLTVDGDLSAGEPEHVDVEHAVLEAQVDARVVEALAVEAFADADGVQHVDGVLLEQARADPLLDVVAAARLEHDAVDPGLLQDQRQRESGGPRADDRDLGSHRGIHPIRCTYAAQLFA